MEEGRKEGQKGMAAAAAAAAAAATGIGPRNDQYRCFGTGIPGRPDENGIDVYFDD